MAIKYSDSGLKQVGAQFLIQLDTNDPELMEKLKGVKGDTGSPGPRGDVGMKGDVGPPSKIPGPVGPQGETGQAGPKGDTGPQGIKGDSGEKWSEEEVAILVRKVLKNL